jgi:hypothetical protein
MKEAESFHLAIDAVMGEDNKVKNNMSVKVKCTEDFALSVLLNLISQNKELKELLMMALLADMDGIKIETTEVEPDL